MSGIVLTVRQLGAGNNFNSSLAQVPCPEHDEKVRFPRSSHRGFLKRFELGTGNREARYIHYLVRSKCLIAQAPVAGSYCCGIADAETRRYNNSSSVTKSSSSTPSPHRLTRLVQNRSGWRSTSCVPRKHIYSADPSSQTWRTSETSRSRRSKTMPPFGSGTILSGTGNPASRYRSAKSRDNRTMVAVGASIPSSSSWLGSLQPLQQLLID